jgi:hypothetical protein
MACVVVWGIAAFLSVPLLNDLSADDLPTLMVLPSLTPSARPTTTSLPTITYTPTQTFTATSTATVTASATPTSTATLATRVLSLSAVMPGVYLSPSLTPFPQGTILLSAPPNPIEPLPDATLLPPPYPGWYSFESDNPNVIYSSPWESRLVREASRGEYHRSEDIRSTIAFTFEGEGLRVRYVAARNMGMFDLIVDGRLLATIDAYSPELSFPGTQVYFVGSGTHQLLIGNSGRKNSASEGNTVGLDAIQVFHGSSNTLIFPPPQMTQTATPAPIPVKHIELISAPPTLQPTTLPITPSPIQITVIIAYDENRNRAVDPAEGVEGIPVRIVTVGTNRVIAQGFTDSSGFAQIEVLLDSDVRVVVPYFGRIWNLPRSRSGDIPPFTLLLTPGNQPSLIP